MTDEEVEISNYLRERWGKHFVKARIVRDNVIDITVSQDLFFAWDDNEHWSDCEWGTAKSNLDPIFEKGSKWDKHKCWFGHGPTMIGGWSDINWKEQSLDDDSFREKIFRLLGDKKTSPEELGLSQDLVSLLGSKGIHWEDDQWIDLDDFISV